MAVDFLFLRLVSWDCFSLFLFFIQILSSFVEVNQQLLLLWWVYIRCELQWTIHTCFLPAVPSPGDHTLLRAWSLLLDLLYSALPSTGGERPPTTELQFHELSVSSPTSTRSLHRAWLCGRGAVRHLRHYYWDVSVNTLITERVTFRTLQCCERIQYISQVKEHLCLWKIRNNKGDLFSLSSIHVNIPLLK